MPEMFIQRDATFMGISCIPFLMRDNIVLRAPWGAVLRGESRPEV